MPKILLSVPYYSQRDSRYPRQAHRMCYSSTNAMLLKYLKPKALPDKQTADDTYLDEVFKHGDTIDASAQMAALKKFGVNAQFRQNLNWADIDAQLAKGKPVPVGILHHGPVNAPSGGGHWILMIGRTEDGSGYYVNDPYGDLDLVKGVYVSTNGKGLVYSKKNLGPRWRVGGAGGWGIVV